MSSKRRHCHMWLQSHCLLVVSFLAVMASQLPSETHAQNAEQTLRLLRYFQAEHQSLHEKFLQSLGSLSAWCDGRNLNEPAARIRGLKVPFSADGVAWETLPTDVQPPIPTGLSPDEREWRERLRSLCQDYAKDLYLLSRRVLRKGFPRYTYSLVREVAYYDPDHESARRQLGFERYGDQWVTPFTALMLRKRFVWHDRFGWLPQAYVSRYEQGQRYFRGWMDAAEEAEHRRDFRNAWEVRTDHYLVKTNHSLEQGVILAKALEEFYNYFRRTFIAFFSTPEQMEKLFEGRVAATRRSQLEKPYEVHFFRNQNEYIQQLQIRIPQIAITNGLYMLEDRVVYTFHNPDPDADVMSTLFHEATHQLFYQSQSRDRRVADTEHFWIVEGIACYMESVRKTPSGMSTGNPSHVRFQAARHRLLVDGFYIPLAQFTRLSKDEFQYHTDIEKVYTQASGLAHFFMHYDGGRYRDALIEHLSQLYSYNPRSMSRVQSLDELTGVSFDELDRQYREHMQSLPVEIESVAG